MKMNFVEREAPFKIEIIDENAEVAAAYETLFYNNRGNASFIVDSDELYDYFKSPRALSKMLVTFYHGHHVCTLDGRFMRTTMEFGLKLVEIQIVSEIRTAYRRAQKRFETFVHVMLYSIFENDKSEFLCEGEANDISIEAISMKCDVDLSGRGDKFIVDFSLFNKYDFTIPVDVLNMRESPKGAVHAYDYVLKFNFDDRPEQKDRLIHLFFDNILGTKVT